MGIITKVSFNDKIFYASVVKRGLSYLSTYRGVDFKDTRSRIQSIRIIITK